MSNDCDFVLLTSTRLLCSHWKIFLGPLSMKAMQVWYEIFKLQGLKYSIIDIEPVFKVTAHWSLIYRMKSGIWVSLELVKCRSEKIALVYITMEQPDKNSRDK